MKIVKKSIRKFIRSFGYDVYKTTSKYYDIAVELDEVEIDLIINTCISIRSVL